MRKSFPPPLVVYKLAVSPRQNFEIKCVIYKFINKNTTRPKRAINLAVRKISRSNFLPCPRWKERPGCGRWGRWSRCGRTWWRMGRQTWFDNASFWLGGKRHLLTLPLRHFWKKGERRSQGPTCCQAETATLLQHLETLLSRSWIMSAWSVLSMFARHIVANSCSLRFV